MGVSVRTEVRGAGQVLTELKEGEAGTGPWVNFLVRTDDNNIIRVQLWNTPLSECVAAWGTHDYKGRRCGFKGVLGGVYDEKASVGCRIDDIKMGW